MVQSRPTIAQLLPTEARAGSDRLAVALARKLGDRYRFIFICMDEHGALGQKLDAQGFEVAYLPSGNDAGRSTVKSLRQCMRQHHVALIHAHQYSPFLCAAMARGVYPSLRRKPSILLTGHGRAFPDPCGLKRVVANRFLLTRHDRVTAVGQFAKQDLVAHEGIDERRIEVIYHGIDPSKFSSASRNGEAASIHREVRARLGVRPDAKLIIQVAQLQPEKDHVTAVAALAFVVRAVPDAVLVMVGDGVEKRRLIAKAVEFGVANNIRMLGARSDVRRLMAAADVCLLSSLHEGVSVTLLAAMALSKPIVATDVGGNSEIVEHGRNGMLCRSSDARGIGHSLITLLRNVKMRSQMGRAGRTRLLQRFTHERMQAGYAHVYEQMLGRRQGSDVTVPRRAPQRRYTSDSFAAPAPDRVTV